MSMKDTTEARERLALAVDQMVSSDGFSAFLRARALFPSYSLNNVCLIAAQAPHATRVCGFGSWKALGRYVKRGERGIRILAPCRVKAGEIESDEGTRATFRVVGFRAVSVFDISQTEGEPLPELEYRPLEGEAPDLADFLCGVAMGAGLEIRREPLSGGVHGYLRRSENLIVVDSACSGAMAAKVAVHELGHLSDPWLTEHPEQYAAHRGDCEAVAESVAYVVCAAYGIDAGPSAVGYVASWTDGDAAKVRDLAERIDAAVAAILGRGTSTEVAGEVAA
jgi:antirestriction protein ArdC